MDIDFQKLNHFVTVARHRNLSRAAVELNISQPALSRSIAALERRSGLRLFDRGRSGMALTPSGQVIFLEAEKIIRDARELDRHMKLSGSGDGGRVCLGVTPALSAILLPHLGTKMLNSKPMAQMIASIRPADGLMEDLLDGKIDLMISPRKTPLPSFDLCSEDIGGFSNVLVARYSHPLFAQASIAEADLASFPLAAVASHPLRPVFRAAGAFICENDSIIREVVLNSDAVWMASRQIVAADLARGSLRRLEIDGIPEMAVPVALIHLAARPPTALAQQLVDWAKAFLAA